MNDVEYDIKTYLEESIIDCPDCSGYTSDDQYICPTCHCIGGNGVINVLEYLKENTSFLERS